MAQGFRLVVGGESMSVQSSCFCHTCSALLGEPLSAGARRLQPSRMLEEHSSGVAYGYGLHPGLLKTRGISSPGDTLTHPAK